MDSQKGGGGARVEKYVKLGDSGFSVEQIELI